VGRDKCCDYTPCVLPADRCCFVLWVCLSAGLSVCHKSATSSDRVAPEQIDSNCLFLNMCIQLRGRLPLQGQTLEMSSAATSTVVLVVCDCLNVGDFMSMFISLCASMQHYTKHLQHYSKHVQHYTKHVQHYTKHCNIKRNTCNITGKQLQLLSSDLQNI